MIENEYLNLLTKKNSLLKKIFAYTQSKIFKISEEEVERIEYYLTNREKMFDNLYDIDNKIKMLASNNKNYINNDDYNKIIKENNLIIKDIIKLDEEKNLIMESIFKLLKKELNSVKSLSKVNKSYFGIYENTVGGNLFDSSR